MAFCTNCGNKLENEELLCPNCNAYQEKPESVDSASMSSASPEPFYQQPPNQQPGQPMYQQPGQPGQPMYQQPGQPGQPMYQQPYQNYQPQGTVDNGGFGWGLLGCCIPVVGLILFLIWKDQKPKTAKAAGIGALVSVVLGVVWYIIVIILGLAAGMV